MELLLIAVIFAVNIPNYIAWFLLYRLFKDNLQTPEKVIAKRRMEVAPFVTPMKDEDHIELSEVDEELIKESVKSRIENGVPPEPKDEEEPSLYT